MYMPKSLLVNFIMSWDQVEEEMENVEKIVQAMEIDEKKEDPIELGARPKETSKVEVTSEVMKSGGGRILQPSLSGSEPGTVIRTSTDVGSPPSYRRFSSPRPPRFTIERKMSAGILRTSPAERGRKKSGGGQSAEPTSPAPSVDRLSVTFADIENQKEDNPEKVETLPQPDSGEVNAELTVEAIEVLGADVVATLGQPSEEYTDSILELQRSKSRGSNVVSQDPSGRRRSSGGGHHRRGGVPLEPARRARRDARMARRALVRRLGAQPERLPPLHPSRGATPRRRGNDPQGRPRSPAR